MYRVYNCSASNRTRIPFKDLQGVLNDQLHVVSDLLTGICLSLRTLSYCKTMFWYSIVILLVRSGWVMTTYSKDTSVIFYMASGFGGNLGDTMTRSYCLSLRTLSYCKTMFWYSIVILLVRSGWVTTSYSKDTSVILYMASVILQNHVLVFHCDTSCEIWLGNDLVL